MHKDLLQRVQTEADLCRNDGADDIAKLLDDVERALSAEPSSLLAWLDPGQQSASLAFAWPSIHRPDSVWTVPVFRLPARLYLVGQLRGPSWELQGVFSSPEDADAACLTRACFMYPITLDEQQPLETTPPKPSSVRWPRCNGGEPIEYFARAWAARDVLAERDRQVTAEGWTPQHDDEHDDGSMAVAAAAYALADHPAVGAESASRLWDAAEWDLAWFKPADKRRNLVRAAALLLAEIERMDRAAEGQAT